MNSLEFERIPRIPRNYWASEYRVTVLGVELLASYEVLGSPRKS